MTFQPFSLPAGGRIARATALDFTFNGRAYQGHDGDTLASALLANGVRLVGRSFKYPRPSGILRAGAADPWLGSVFTMNSLRGVVSKKKRRFQKDRWALTGLSLTLSPKR